MATIFLADDHSSTRSALTLLLTTRLGVHDILEFPEWTSLLRQAGQESRIPPGGREAVILLDWELPGCPALEGLARLQTILPECKIIALSARMEARREALEAGVDAFIAKSEPPEKVVEVIRSFIGDIPVRKAFLG